MRTIRVLLAVLFIATALPGTARAQVRTLTVFAAASLSDAFTELANGFTAENVDVEVVFNFGSSSTLAAQLAEGAPADLFASANIRQMEVAQAAERIAGEPAIFAHNRLVVIMPADNPAAITELADLAKDGVKLVVAAPAVPVRDYTDAMLDLLAEAEGYGAGYKTAVLSNIVSEEDNVRQVVVKVALGEADAGVVYASDVTPDVADAVTVLAIPDAFNTIASYPIGITGDAAEPALAQTFVEYLLCDAGQDTLVKWGFISIREDAHAAPQTTPQAASDANATPESH